MHHGGGFLEGLAIVLGTALLTTILCQRLRQPVVLGYLLAGVLVGPHVGFLGHGLEQEGVGTVETLAELGVILLMFSLGLEFRLKKVLAMGPRTAAIGAVEVGLVAWLGFLVGQSFGWSTKASVFAGGIVAISSTMIVAKTFAEVRTDRRVMDLVFGILIFEDLAAILMLATLTAVVSGAGVSPGLFALSAVKLAGFLFCLVTVGLLLVPRLMSYVVRNGRPETILVASVGACFLMAVLAERFGYSVGLGAFLAGALAAESGHSRTLSYTVRPLRDLFAAIFFVSVGMLIDPALILEHKEAICLLTLVVIGGKVVGVSLGAVLAGHSTQRAVQAGLSLTQIGEFSFMIAAVALPLGEQARFLYPVAVSVCVLTSFATPFFVRRSEGAARWVDARVPRPLQTFLTFYGAWLGRMRSPKEETAWTRIRRLGFLSVIEAGFLTGIIIGFSISLPRLAGLLERYTGMSIRWGSLLLIGLGAVACIPFCLGIYHCAQRLGVLFASFAMPPSPQGDRAHAPRRSLVLALQVAIFLALVLPVLALIQPFLPPLPGIGVLALLGAVSAVAFWRSTHTLEGHVRAGAVMMAEVLARQSRDSIPLALGQVQELMPGLGELTPVRIDPQSAAVGKNLVQLDLRGRTGATVVCITRRGEGVLAPSGDELIAAGDLLVLSGEPEAVRSARTILARREVDEASLAA